LNALHSDIALIILLHILKPSAHHTPEVMQKAILDAPDYVRIVRQAADLPATWCGISRQPYEYHRLEL
jgi:hypothetical protein